MAPHTTQSRMSWSGTQYVGRADSRNTSENKYALRKVARPSQVVGGGGEFEQIEGAVVFMTTAPTWEGVDHVVCNKDDCNVIQMGTLLN